MNPFGSTSRNKEMKSIMSKTVDNPDMGTDTKSARDFQTLKCGYRDPLSDGRVACLCILPCPHKYDNYDQRFGIGYWMACKFEEGK
jgi:hypothetical protein